MKLPRKNHAGETENLGDFCVRVFSRESDRLESGFISLYSGVPVVESDAKKRGKRAPGFNGVQGKVIT